MFPTSFSSFRYKTVDRVEVENFIGECKTSLITLFKLTMDRSSDDIIWPDSKVKNV